MISEIKAQKAVEYGKNMIMQLKKLGVQPSSKENPLANTYLEKFFATKEGKEARAMNLAALKGIKGAPLEKPVAKYSEDIKLLSSNDADMVKKWTQWINPSSGKMYTVIRKKDNPDGTILVRVLDETGELVKEKNIKPKNMVVIDMFDDEIFAHGQYTDKIIERNNPLCNTECINVSYFGSPYAPKVIRWLKKILKAMEGGKKIDAINLCVGGAKSFNSTNEVNELVKKSYPAAKQLLFNYEGEEKMLQDEIIPLIQKITDDGVRVVVAAGNSSKGEDIVYWYGIDGVDFVGALNQNGQLSYYSSSRPFCKHYETGDFNVQVLKNGVNITGKPGVDISYKNTWFEPLQGKKPEDCLISSKESRELEEIMEKYPDLDIGEGIDKEEYDKIIEKYGDKIVCTGDNKYAKAFDPMYTSDVITTDECGYMIPFLKRHQICGTSFAAPQRTARITLNETMKEILNS